MKIVSFYEMAPGRSPSSRTITRHIARGSRSFTRAASCFRPAHWAILRKSAMGVFTTREAAEEFIKGDHS
jgi:hypothetical protein